MRRIVIRMSVRPLAYLENYTAELHQIFCICWTWQYDMYFRFCGWRYVFTLRCASFVFL